jgi:hypothetical protein
MIPRPNYFVGIQVSNPEVYYESYCPSLIDGFIVKFQFITFCGGH